MSSEFPNGPADESLPDDSSEIRPEDLPSPPLPTTPPTPMRIGETDPTSAGRIVAPLGPDDERLDPRVVTYWILSGLISILFLGAIAAGALYAFREQLPGGLERWVVGVIVVFGLLLVWQFVHPPLNYRRWRFRLDDRLLQVRWGVLVHEEKAIPMSRLQHIDLVRGPLERMFGLATLIVFTAGSEAATFRVPGLLPEHAEVLRDRIVSARGADVL